MTLIDRIASAQPEEQRELFEEGAYLLRPVWFAVATDWDDPGYERFSAMLDAGAYLDAVLLMLPEDRPRWAVTGRNSATVGNKDGAPGPLVWVFATTPALALLAAILKAGGHDAA